MSTIFEDNNGVTITTTTGTTTLDSDELTYGSGLGDIVIGGNTCWPRSNSILLGPRGMQGTATSYGMVNLKYVIMDVPRKESPIAVFVGGRLLTLGIMGSDVECAFTGSGLLFTPGTITSGIYLNTARQTISIEYDDEILHYNVSSDDYGALKYKSENSLILDATLVSSIKKKGKLETLGSEEQ